MANGIVTSRGFDTVPVMPQSDAFARGMMQMVAGRQRAQQRDDRRQAGIFAQLLKNQDPNQTTMMLQQFINSDPSDDIRGELEEVLRVHQQDPMSARTMVETALMGSPYAGMIPKMGAEETVVLGEGQQLIGRQSGRVIAENLKDQLSGKDKFDQASKLREELRKADPDFRKIKDAYGRIQASAVDPSPAGDLALIFNYMKLLDPGSTVREGEFATAQGAMGALDRAEESGEMVPNFVKSAVQRLFEGTRLIPEQRADFLDRSERLYQSQENAFNERAGVILDVADQFGIERELIMGKQKKQKPKTDFKGRFNKLPEAEKIKFIQNATPEELRKIGIL